MFEQILENVSRKTPLIHCGVTFVQLREKGLSPEAFLAEARRIQPVCARGRVPFVVNDNVEAALQSGADSVHAGQQDMRAGDIRAVAETLYTLTKELIS